MRLVFTDRSAYQSHTQAYKPLDSPYTCKRAHCRLEHTSRRNCNDDQYTDSCFLQIKKRPINQNPINPLSLSLCLSVTVFTSYIKDKYEQIDENFVDPINYSLPDHFSFLYFQVSLLITTEKILFRVVENEKIN